MLTLDSVAIRRGDKLLLTGVSFALRAGEAVHLKAANGVGKSSLLRAVAELLPVAAGSIAHQNAHGPAEAADQVALLDEQPGLKASESLRGNLTSLSILLSGRTPGAGELDAVADRLGLAPLFDSPVRYFSTGQRRRAVLARLLLSARTLWLLDEPYTGLDQAGRALLDTLIAEHRNAGGAVLMTHHGDVPDMSVIDLMGHVPQVAPDTGDDGERW